MIRHPLQLLLRLTCSSSAQDTVIKPLSNVECVYVLPRCSHASHVISQKLCRRDGVFDRIQLSRDLYGRTPMVVNAKKKRKMWSDIHHSLWPFPRISCSLFNPNQFVYITYMFLGVMHAFLLDPVSMKLYHCVFLAFGTSKTRHANEPAKTWNTNLRPSIVIAICVQHLIVAFFISF